MQMIDVMKRLAELDAQNPNIVKESSQSVEECGMGALGGMSQPHTPASINMTAASGEELSSMLKDIMTLAGRPMGGEEPVGGADGIAVVDTEPSGEIDVGADSEVGVDDHEPSIMRSMLDKLNPGDDEDEPEDEPEDEKPVEEYDNSPDVETQGYDSMVPSGNDLHKEKNQYPAAQPGDNAMSMEESLMNEWKKFVAEGVSQETLDSMSKKYNELGTTPVHNMSKDQRYLHSREGFEYAMFLRNANANEPSADVMSKWSLDFISGFKQGWGAPSKEISRAMQNIVNYRKDQGVAEQDDEGESDPLKNREKYAQQHGQGQVYKKTYPGNKTGMTKSFAYDIKRTGPKGPLPKEGVEEQLDILKLAGLK